ncbi:2-amino-4-hydroxy-6-hydroxymethyldihydropteridine diphosphokinase [Aureimonas fodinaquatilis]|uniref:2-amino-4-hydroxy-6-hydroxymethyldihydropteridine pyrophosphokinase n=1 Tax=Aureimonas fodinaquatilis TaxID=2565783 RepID=A0A5B0E2R6_9HYPH|nr:2-amino-4-hydroxy-6-hydroxymethyldihydropteridine diphosphokinase [Aureimonas fodinaquatilis]KAA0972622.1 2-amino-4-hydroxy-6-hydroxymethyldihydropteridine diphosphokinase [Aureimonas fodinaquatilis]
MNRACIGLGGNIGEPVANMRRALEILSHSENTSVLAVSRLYKTPPWGVTDQPDFFNACALLETALQPELLLDLCLSVEISLKRQRHMRWGPRTIDIDVLTYGETHWASERLELPHPRIQERAFVLCPLADIAPDMAVAGKTVRHWLSMTDTAGIDAVSADGTWWQDQKVY